MKFSKSRNFGVPEIYYQKLLAYLGNFVNRVMKFVTTKYDSTILSFSCDSESEQTLIKNINKLLTNYIEALENIKSRAGLEIGLEISQQGNGYLQESKFDNTFLRNALRGLMAEEFNKKFAGESRDDKKTAKQKNHKSV
ncbi:8200_t:CDS:2 [Cetraspora pellucida]|uniref:8200_t:CDS:1 n=1 Tax=Cetraspora pellucida TaxID=1433469 RepID=A0ACA9PRV0_9GLOM|nr:8200_t:CDS:2 [Cetraspora pellucida]